MADETFNLPEFDLTEQLADASVNADEWLDQAVHRIDARLGEEITVQQAICVAGFMIAAGLSYHADRQVDAAELIARAILQNGEGGDRD